MTCLKLPLALAMAAVTWAAELPVRYFELLEAGARKVESRLAAEPGVDLEHAVGALSVPIRLQAQPGRPVRPNEQEIVFRLATE